MVEARTPPRLVEQQLLEPGADVGEVREHAGWSSRSSGSGPRARARTGGGATPSRGGPGAGDAQVEHRAVGEPARRRRDVFGRRHALRQPDRLVLGALLVDVERHEQAHDDLAVLARRHVAGRERAAVAIAVDVQDRRTVGLPGAQEVAVQRVDAAVVGHGEAGGPRGLRRDLAAEETWSTDVTVGLTPRKMSRSSSSRSRTSRSSATSRDSASPRSTGSVVSSTPGTVDGRSGLLGRVTWSGCQGASKLPTAVSATVRAPGVSPPCRPGRGGHRGRRGPRPRGAGPRPARHRSRPRVSSTPTRPMRRSTRSSW